MDFSLRGSNVRCDLFLRDDLWAADIDAGQISQVIHNLIINANQAMPNGGIIEVHAENMTVDDTTPEYLLALKQGQYVKISIKDQGMGIAEERLQKIFDPYFTTKQTGADSASSPRTQSSKNTMAISMSPPQSGSAPPFISISPPRKNPSPPSNKVRRSHSWAGAGFSSWKTKPISAM